jgi:hypothetical protein
LASVQASPLCIAVQNKLNLTAALCRKPWRHSIVSFPLPSSSSVLDMLLQQQLVLLRLVTPAPPLSGALLAPLPASIVLKLYIRL